MVLYKAAVQKNILVLACKLFQLKLAIFQGKKLNANVQVRVYYVWFLILFAYWLVNTHTHTQYQF